MSKASEQARRISVRLSPQLKVMIERAAASRGQSLNQFLIATLAERANAVLESCEALEFRHATDASRSPEPARDATDSGVLQGSARLHRNCALRPVSDTLPSLKPRVVISLEPYSSRRLFA